MSQYDLCGDLDIATNRSGKHLLDFQTSLFLDHVTGRAGSDQAESGKNVFVLTNKGEHLIFFAIVGNQRDCLQNITILLYEALAGCVK